MNDWTAIASVLALLGGAPLLGCEDPIEDTEGEIREDIQEQREAQLERSGEVLEEMAEGRAEVESAAAGDNELTQELRGTVAEEQMEGTLEEHAERMRELQRPGR